MNIDRVYIQPLYLLLSFSQVVRILNVASSLSDCTPNGEFFGINKSSVKPKKTLCNPSVYIPDFTVYTFG